MRKNNKIIWMTTGKEEGSKDGKKEEKSKSR